MTEGELSTYNGEVKKHLKRNVIFTILDGNFFSFGLTFIALETIMPVLVVKLGGSNLMVSLIPLITLVTISLSPALTTHYIERQERKMKSIMVLGFLMRIPWLFMGIGCWFLGAHHPRILLIAIFAILVFYGTTAGMVIPSWFDLVAKVIPERLRGRLFSARLTIGHVLGILGGLGSAAILRSVAFPYSYSILFFIATVLFMISLAMIALIKEPVHPAKTEPKTMAAFLKTIPQVVKSDRNFVYFIITRAVLVIGHSAGAFFAVYALKRFQVGESYAGIFTTITTASCIFLSPLVGLIADKWGHKPNFVIGSLCACGAAMVALTSSSILPYYAVFVLLAYLRAVRFISPMAMTVEFCRPEQRPLYLATSQIMMTPFGLLTLAMGSIADMLGYAQLFLVIIVISLAGAVFTAAMLKDPRKTNGVKPA